MGTTLGALAEGLANERLGRPLHSLVLIGCELHYLEEAMYKLYAL